MAIAAHLKEILVDKALTPQPTNDGIRLREKGVMEVEVVNPAAGPYGHRHGEAR